MSDLSNAAPGFSTRALHEGFSHDPATYACALPIYQTSSYVFENVEHAANLFDLKQDGYIYTRIMNPTTDVLEKRLASLEGGVGALALASGMAAITAAIQTVAGAGDEIISAETLYGGTHTLFADRLPKRMGITVHFADIDDLAQIESKITDKTKAIYFESIGNPGVNIPDIEAVCALAHRHGIVVICDNTFGSPYLIQLREFGVDVSVHSLTKYIGGHGTSIGGAIVDLGAFPWKDNPRYLDFNEPDPTYHGLVYADVPQNAGYISKARAQVLRDMGASLSPFNAFLFVQGIETLSLRVERHCRNAERVAEFLAAHPCVSWVKYPTLPGDPYHARQQKFFPRGAGAIMTFGIKGGLEAGKRFIGALRYFKLLANVADARSLVIHPASTTHGQLSEEELIAGGISSDMIRLSVGLEDIEDLLADLDQALCASSQA